MGGVAMMFQTPALLDWRSVDFNVTLPREVRVFEHDRATELGRLLVEKVGLAEFWVEGHTSYREKCSSGSF